MVVLIPTEGHTDERVEPRDTPSCMRSEASAVLSYLALSVACLSLANGHASIAGAHGRSLRHLSLIHI